MSTVTDRIGGARASLAFKAPCRVATGANITLSGFQTIDGVTLAAGDANLRVLVKAQTDATENGIYEARATAWVRAKDFDGADDVAQGTYVYAHNGSAEAGAYRVTTADPITIGSSSITFVTLGNIEFLSALAAAQASADAAAASEAAAAISESNAASSESNAATSESNASTSASNASTSAGNASTSASNASTSAGNAATSESNAAASAASAAGNAGYINVVTVHSVDNTGATDCSAALQTAINTVSNTDGKGVYIPAGTYDVDDATITLPDGCDLVCHPEAEIRRTNDPVTPAPMIAMGNDCRIRGGKFTNTEVTATANTDSVAIRAASKSRVWVTDCYIEGQFYLGIAYDTVVDGVIRGCSVYKVAYIGINIDGVCDDVRVSDCFVSGYITGATKHTDYGYLASAAAAGTLSDLVINNCTCEGAELNGFTVSDLTERVIVTGCEANDCGDHGFVAIRANSNNPTRVTFANCVAASCTNMGFYLYDADHCSVLGCTAQACGDTSEAGILLAGATYCIVQGCRANGGTGSGIRIQTSAATSVHSSRNIVNGCICFSNTERGLYIVDANQYGTTYNNIIAYSNTTAEITDSGTASTNANLTT